MERAALTWFANYEAREDRAPAPAKWDPLNVQSGIIEPTRALRMVAWCWLSCENPAAARDMLEYLEPGNLSILRPASDTHRGGRRPGPSLTSDLPPRGSISRAFRRGPSTCCHLSSAQGMAARASILGDLRCNNPINWSLPERNWRSEQPPDDRERVELSSVHAIVQYACAGSASAEWQDSSKTKITRCVAAVCKCFRERAFRQGRANRFGAVHATLSRSG